ncbi:MAG: hypothetical protein GEU80_06065 [Dehalococcoidia bacterium]|nr:hypothetical protein [Dehalococcoidia bacterium]
MLQGTRVIELSTDVAGAFTGKLLAAYGADVILVEPPDGNPLRHFEPRLHGPDGSVLAAYLHAGKRSVVLDPHTEGDRERLRRLLGGADVVLDSHAPGELAARGIDPAALIKERPSLVVTSITPFGLTGPRAGWRATALTAFAAGGQMGVCGDPDEPPLKTAGHQAHYQAGLHAFAATMTALYAARHTGVGDHLDLSVQEVQAVTLEGSGANALVRGSEAGRNGNRTFAQWGIHECADGYVGVAAMPRQTGSVYEAIGHPEFKADPAVANGWSPGGDALMSTLIPQWTAERTAAQIFERAAEVRAPFAMIPTPRELLEWPALVESGFWRGVEHPVLGRHPLPAGPLEVNGHDRGEHRPAPLLGEHTEEVLAEAAGAPRTSHAPSAPSVDPHSPPPALDGVRVIDVTQIWAGPYGTRLLGDMGADVIKVEGPTFADNVRTMGGATSAPAINLSSYFNDYNRNKRGISLDLQHPEGHEAMRRLLASADVFIENWSSGVADRLGLGYEALHALNPRLIYVTMPGFGHHGGDSARVGFGPTIEQMGGLVALQGYEGGPPHRSGISYGDPNAGTTAAAAVAMALVNRERTGEGCHVLVPQRDVIVQFVGEFVLAEALGCPFPMRTGSRDAFLAPHNVYRASDSETRQILGPTGNVLREVNDRWLAIAVDSDEAWRALRSAIGDRRLDDPALDTAAGRKAAEADIDAAIAEWTRARDADEAAVLLQSAGVAASPVLTPWLVARDEHLAVRGAFLGYDHPDAGRQRCTAPAWRLARRPVTSVRAAPQFGQHTVEVLTEAGYAASRIEAMMELGIITEDLLSV